MSADDFPAPTITSVTGGAYSVAAEMDDLERVSTLSTNLAEDVRALRSRVADIVSDGALLGAAALDPLGVADVELKLNNVMNGPVGLASFSDDLDERAAQLNLVRQNYIDSDERQAGFMDAINWLSGITGTVIVDTVIQGVGDIVVQGNIKRISQGTLDDPSLASDPLAWILGHPGVTEAKLQAIPGLLGHGPGTSYQDVVRLLAEQLNDGRGVAVTDKFANLFQGDLPPANDLSGLISNLGERNTQAKAGNDEIDVQTITQPDGTVAYVVNIPGTKTDGIELQGLSPYTNDNVTNLVTLAGMTSSREEAIADALAMAGVPHDAPVMLVGHSQGGMVAAQAAADSANGTFDYNITHVVTAGSPVALADVPPTVQVLSLENVNDLVPQLDGEPNPASANHTTVRFESDTGTFDNHSLNAAYQAMADQLSEHPDMAPSVEAFMDSARAFLADPNGQTTATTSIYDLHREEG